MRKLDLAGATISELTDEFLRLAIAKGDAVMEFETRKVNRLYWQMEAVEEELKHRPGDQRRWRRWSCYRNSRVRFSR